MFSGSFFKKLSSPASSTSNNLSEDSKPTTSALEVNNAVDDTPNKVLVYEDEDESEDNIVEVFENERLDAKANAFSYLHLLTSDPKRYKYATMQSDNFINPPLDINMTFVDDW